MPIAMSAIARSTISCMARDLWRGMARSASVPMCAPSSSASARNSATWTRNSRRSRTTRASATGGWMVPNNRGLFWRLVHSFTLKLVLLAVVLLSVPLILYWQFARAEEEQLALIGNAVEQTNHVLAAMLRGHFEKFASEPEGEMREALARAAVGQTRIKILVRLKDSENFLYVASVPPVSQKYLDAERTELIRSGLFHRLGPSCDGGANLDMRYVNPAGKQEVLAAMT